MERRILWTLLLVVLLQDSLAFPRTDSSSSSESNEDDTQQQQQQSIDTESLGEFTNKIKTKGRTNANDKLKEAEDLDDPCLDPKRIGLCKAAVPRFFFNKASGKCEFYIFGGCGGNRNNFKELSECETTCAKHIRKDVSPKVSDSEDFCKLPAMRSNSGIMCTAYMPRWTYNSTNEKCEEFIYGGCGGTKNIFKTETECESTCGMNKMPETSENTATSTGSPAIIITKNSDACNLPMDKGLCYAIKYKYFFNKEDNRCEKFEYGGCGGNSNRFNTAEECVHACGGDVPAHDAECSNVKCPWELYTHYTTLDCKPVYDGQACCPTRFECPERPQSNNTIDGARSLTLPPEEAAQPKCSYKGKSYNVGENVPEASDAGSCRAACICTQGFGPNEGAKITCASIECPEQLGPIPPSRIGCIPLYKRGSCCAHDFYCPDNSLTIIEPQAPETSGTAQENFKCEVDGKAYVEGQRFYPKQHPCLKCICQKGFDGNITNEICENVDCGIEIYYSHYLAKGCAPVYFQSEDGSSSCCPISWECPDDRTETSTTPVPLPPKPVPVGPVPPTKPDGTSPISVTPGTEPSVLVPGPTPAILPPRPEREGRRIIVNVEACQLPKAVGNCKANRPRYFYNNETNACELFGYSGCQGNENNFASAQDCQRLCLPIPSDNRVLLRSLDSDQQGARPRAIYGNCSQKLYTAALKPFHCQCQVCADRYDSRTRYFTVTEVDPCTQPMSRGNCKAYFPRFYYSPEKGECQIFIFGGCKGNRNNFYTKESCEATCSNSVSTGNLRTANVGDASTVNFGEDVHPPSPTNSIKSIGLDVDPCSLPKTVGFCKASIRRFHYDSAARECREFIYGGCGGNANNFLNSRDCERRCIIKEYGAPQSRLQLQRPRTEESNSSTPEEMTGVRPSSSSFLERCRLPRQSGSCLGVRPSYYFDADTEKCTFFFYSGCFGNANRFSSMEECESTCKNSTASVPTATNEQEGIGGRISPNNRNSMSWRSIPTVPTTESENTESILPPKPSSRPKPNAGQANKDENNKDMCKLGPEAGRCKAYEQRYYWDAGMQKCSPFVYSGCRGNKNNFLSESDCLSACGDQPTIEQLTSEGVLSCTFGNETLPLGATVGGHRDEIPCGVPVCQCLTPPSVTCVQLMCPTPPVPVTEKTCPSTPGCGSNCKEAVGPDGCPTCDCPDDDSEDTQQVQVQEPEVFVKSVKG